jgi:Armadillo/beta-catenin-like repeat
MGGFIDGGDGQQRRAILDHDPVPCLHGLLSSPNGDVRNKTCMTIAIIVSEFPDQLPKVFENGLAPPLLRCLADADPDVRDSAAWAMFYITMSGTPQQSQRLVEEGCVPLLCGLLTADGGGGEDAAATLLDALKSVEHLLLAGARLALRGGGTGTSNPVAASISEAGGVAKIRDLRAHADGGIRQLVARLLTTHFRNADAGEHEGPDAVAVAAEPVRGPIEDGGDGEMEPPRQRLRLS